MINRPKCGSTLLQSTLEGLRHEDYCEFKANLDYKKLNQLSACLACTKHEKHT